MSTRNAAGMTRNEKKGTRMALDKNPEKEIWLNWIRHTGTVKIQAENDNNRHDENI
jgi:hypothetical protein